MGSDRQILLATQNEWLPTTILAPDAIHYGRYARHYTSCSSLKLPVFLLKVLVYIGAKSLLNHWLHRDHGIPRLSNILISLAEPDEDEVSRFEALSRSFSPISFKNYVKRSKKISPEVVARQPDSTSISLLSLSLFSLSHSPHNFYMPRTLSPVSSSRNFYFLCVSELSVSRRKT